MNLENQVCSLEQSQKLLELGVDQKSLFYFIQEKTPTNPHLHLYGVDQEHMPINLLFGKRSNLSGSRVFSEISAFTVAELGLMLNSYINHQELSVDGKHFYMGIISGYHDTEASTRAAALIYFLLSERSSLTPALVNERLSS